MEFKVGKRANIHTHKQYAVKYYNVLILIRHRQDHVCELLNTIDACQVFFDIVSETMNTHGANQYNSSALNSTFTEIITALTDSLGGSHSNMATASSSLLSRLSVLSASLLW